MKTHWKGLWGAACGAPATVPLTEDPARVDCRICERRVAAAFRSLDDEIEERTVAKVKQRAVYQATKLLKERHQDEFDSLIQVFANELAESVRTEVRFGLERDRERGERWAAKERARLEAELERLA